MLQISQGAFYARGCVAAACGGKSRARVRIERRGRGRGGVPFAGPWRRALRSEAAEVADEGVKGVPLLGVLALGVVVELHLRELEVDRQVRLDDLGRGVLDEILEVP